MVSIVMRGRFDIQLFDVMRYREERWMVCVLVSNNITDTSIGRHRNERDGEQNYE